MALLALFAAFTMQVRHSPYMSLSERPAVLLYHEEKVVESDARHMKLDAVIKEVKAKLRTLVKGQTMDTLRQRVMQQRRKVGAILAWDYNKVESTLLFSACLVCLSGVMFESSYLEGSADSSVQTLSAFVILMIIVSVVYFLVVFITEVMDAFCPNQLKRFKKESAKSVIELEAERRAKMGVMDDRALEAGSEFQFNPLAGVRKAEGATGGVMSLGDEEVSAAQKVILQKQTPSVQEWMLARNYLNSVEDEIKSTQSEIKALKQALSMAQSMETNAPKKAAGISGAAAAAAAAARSGGRAGPPRPGKKHFEQMQRNASYRGVKADTSDDD